MCLGVPMQLTEMNTESSGVAELDSTQYQIDLSLIDDPALGDYVIVHAGYAIEKLDPAEADERLQLFDQLAKSWANAQ